MVAGTFRGLAARRASRGAAAAAPAAAPTTAAEAAKFPNPFVLILGVAVKAVVLSCGTSPIRNNARLQGERWAGRQKVCWRRTVGAASGIKSCVFCWSILQGHTRACPTRRWRRTEKGASAHHRAPGTAACSVDALSSTALTIYDDPITASRAFASRGLEQQWQQQLWRQRRRWRRWW